MKWKKVVSPGPEVAESILRPGRAGRPEFRLLTRLRLALLLAVAIALPWLRIPEPPPPGLSMQRAHGTPGAMIRQLAINPAESIVATADERGRVIVRAVGDGQGIERRVDVEGFTTALAFSPDGRHLAIGGNKSDVMLCDLSREGRKRLLGIPVRNISDLEFSPDGRTLAIANFRSGEILLWDIETARPRMTLRDHRKAVWLLAFAPDGHSLASVAFADWVVLIWDMDSGQLRHRLSPACVCSLAYSPDGQTLATVSSQENVVRLWNVRTGVAFRTIADRSMPVHSVTFSPDGRLLATAAFDGTASLWSLATGREWKRLDGQSHLLARVAFSADGRTLLAIGNDADIRLWDLEGAGDVE